MTMHEGFADIGDARLHYWAAGDAANPMLVFLHGFPEYGGMWRPVMEKLSSRFYCLAPDQLGYNLSDKPADVTRYRVKNLIEDVRRFVAAFPPKRRFTLVAHDWGGAIAWAYALKYPETLNRLAIINAVHPAAFQREIARNPEQAKASQYIVDMQSADADALYAANDFAKLRWSFSELESSGLFPADQQAAYRSVWSQPGAVTGMLNWYRAMRVVPPDLKAGEGKVDVRKDFDASALVVRVPTLVLWGLQDKALLPGCIEGLDQFVPQLTLKTYADGTHWLVHEKPGEVVRELAACAGGTP
jgi:pimeloyl-ACP methyl ester carboxylesterase